MIFSDEIDPDTIQHQFLNALPRKYQLTPAYKDIAKGAWQALATHESLEDLGNRIIASVPEEKKGQFSAPLIEGFNNINFSLDEILDVLKSHYFEGKFFTAVGKTEWWNIKFNDQSIADKKDIINSVDFVFISAETIADYCKARQQLTKSEVNDRLLDCSDAHCRSSEPKKDRIGNCSTWMKSDPTFDGLRLALIEFEQRVFVGHSPDKVKTVQANRAKYIRTLNITKKPYSNLDEKWFESVNLELNHDLVAIIGNKGSGKSALTDIVGLLGNTRNQERFSFLSPNRFRMASTNKAAHFESVLTWENGHSTIRTLDEETDSSSAEQVKYIPQGLFDDICNEIPGGEEKKFDRELKKVIFSHVSVADRLGFDSLDELLEYQTNETQDAIDILQTELHDLQEEIVRLEEQTTAEYRKRVVTTWRQSRRSWNCMKSTSRQKCPSQIIRHRHIFVRSQRPLI